ncbi:MAG: hypothetical protein J6Y29_01620 [Clostridiales bacterium]|nr:hypothetical protein [Clostridiales bacterium]
MDSIYSRKREIEFSDVDKHLRLKLICAVNIIQNNMTNLFGKLNISNEGIKQRYNAFWVISKLKIHFKKNPMLGEEIDSESFVSNYSKVRLNISHRFSDDSGNIVFEAHQELCPMDMATRKIKALGSIINEEDVVFSKTSFSRFRWNVEDFTKIYSYTICYDDIDSNAHVNNAKYVGFVSNALGSEFFDANRVRDIEVHYINECVEGAHINIYRKNFDSAMGFIIMSGQTKIMEAKVIME